MTRPAQHVIDCDLHNTVPGIGALLPYLPPFWREYVEQSQFKGPNDDAYPPHTAAPITARPDFVPPDGRPAGADLGMMQSQALDAWNVEFGLLNCTYSSDSVHNPDLSLALCGAVNDWQLEHWLQPEPRLRASMVVPARHPELAAHEIDRLGDQPSFVQVLLPVRSEAPYGNRRYHPIYEAAVRHDLVVGLHFGGFPGNPPTPTGWPSYYIEEYAGMAQVFQSQVMSMVAEGVFAAFPDLRVSLIESGFTWLPSLMWRMDKEWKGLRREIPWVKQPPSELIRRHFRASLQPLDAPPEVEHMRQVIRQLESKEMLVFSTDYPHWRFDRPEQAMPAGLSPELEHKILYDNAYKHYRW
jgi:uncharacterized protein